MTSAKTRSRGAKDASRNKVVFPAHARLFSSHLESATAVSIVRKSAEAMTPAEQQIFKSAVTKAIADGSYSRLVNIHADMAHDMHTMGGMPAGTERFLPWHRMFLVTFEQALRVFEPNFFVPHWRWMDKSDIPSWLKKFKPSGVVDENGKPIRITRAPGTSPTARTLPTTSTIQTTVMNRSDYHSFTLALEGANPFGAHNLVHVWFNGTMSRVPHAPADPMFWMHHAELDRIWAIWATAHAGQVPNLSGADAILDPWPEKVTDVLDTRVGAYSYSYDQTIL